MDCNLQQGRGLASLVNATKQGLITEEQIDKVLAKVFQGHIDLGLWDPDNFVPYTKITPDVVAAKFFF